MQKCKILLGALLLALAVATPGFAATTVSGSNKNQPKYPGVCANLPMHVALAPGQPASQNISGTFCYPFKSNEQHAIDILVHGATYDRSYWDSTYNFPNYSYVYRTLNAGRAVFYYDRLGVGKSSRLPSTSVTMAADAEVLHQIIQRFKPAFHNVNVIGHSFGSHLATLESSLYNDASHVVLTDGLHARGPALATGGLQQYPANQDPLFQNANPPLDNGWLTSNPGTRGVFYYSPGADPNEISFDDAHKSIVSSTQLAGGRAQQDAPAGSNVSNQITRPILAIAGQQDVLYCGLALDCTNTANVLANEKPYFTAASSFTAMTTPNTGHDLALHLSASDSFGQINRWLATH